MSRKYLAIVEVNRIRFLKLKKNARPLVTVNGRIYPNDDVYYVRDHLSSDAVRFQRIDSSQIIHCRYVFIDPDMTRAKIDSMKLANTKRKLWTNLDSGQLWKWLTAIAIVGSLIYGFLVMG
jgi:hypothetical protein